jgi:hypothetical protein
LVLQRMSGFNYRYKVRKYFTDMIYILLYFLEIIAKLQHIIFNIFFEECTGFIKTNFFKAGQHRDNYIVSVQCDFVFSLNKTYRCFFSNMARVLYKLTCTTVTFRHAVLLIIQHIIIAIKKYLVHECKTYCMNKIIISHSLATKSRGK